MISHDRVTYPSYTVKKHTTFTGVLYRIYRLRSGGLAKPKPLISKSLMKTREVVLGNVTLFSFLSVVEPSLVMDIQDP